MKSVMWENDRCPDDFDAFISEMEAVAADVAREMERVPEYVVVYIENWF